MDISDQVQLMRVINAAQEKANSEAVADGMNMEINEIDVIDTPDDQGVDI